MSAWRLALLALLAWPSTLAMLTACADGAPVPAGRGSRLEVRVAPLSLPTLTNACYGIAVLDEALAPVWSVPSVCADSYGDGTSDLTYIGTCDATDLNDDGQANATVVLTIVGLYGPDTDGDQAPDLLTDYKNPCAAPYAPNGCRILTTCNENEDVLVELNLTVMREARQGFFDVAITFEDIFCSAKVDCAYPATEAAPARPIELVFDPVSGDRVQTVVWAFACTDGDPGDDADAVSDSTHLYMDDVVLRCGDTRYTIRPSDGPGNLYPGGVGAPAPLVQAMVFEGREAITNGDLDADKLYWNVALGLDADFFSPALPALAPDCVLETRATATRGPLLDGRTPPNTNYPYVLVSVPINSGAAIICTQHGLDAGGDQAGVSTQYTGPSQDGSGFRSIDLGHFAFQSGGSVVTSPIFIDECLEVPSPCAPTAQCFDLDQGFDCRCAPGFDGDPFAAGCVDLDECGLSTDNCSDDATCTNAPGSFECECNPGFTGDGVTCVDIDECQSNNGGCSADATCSNTAGSRTCECDAGFSGDGLTCVDLDECGLETDDCSADATCSNTPGSFECECNPGFTGDGVTCVDIDECQSNNGGCSVNATCSNTTGSRTCECEPGFTGDGLTCTDLDECQTNNGGCAVDALCTNTPGSRTCACGPGLTGDGFTCEYLVTISASTSNYNLFAATGSPTAARAYVVTVAPGVTLSSTSTSVAAFQTGPLPAGSTVRLINNGNLYGAGGRGGNAGDSAYAAAGGGAGGDAIAASVPVTIDNTNGTIFGGGGGGGGGFLCTRSNVLACGGSGGGGRGSTPGAAGSKGTCFSGASYPNGTSGSAGTTAAPGGGGGGASSGYYPNQYSAPFYCTAAGGGAGGDWGASGANSGTSYLDGAVQYSPTAGGAAGHAVRLSNGASVTWLGGNTAARVKGPVL